MIDQMAAEGFNTIRLPYSSEALHTTRRPTASTSTRIPICRDSPRWKSWTRSSSMPGRRACRWYSTTTAAAPVPAPARTDSGTTASTPRINGWPTGRCWPTTTRATPRSSGSTCTTEPYNGTWGGGGAKDWARAAERAGNAVLAVNPDLLIFVEGVGTYKGQSYWWGGNLMGVKDRPITLDVANRVVYSPHDYPNSVFPQTWFQTADFGANLPNVFRNAWGYIYEDNIAPIWVGEFGTKLQDPKDVVWFEAITSYLSGDFDNNGTIDIPAGTGDMSWAYWSWNPNSGDTGGILADDWRTINENKMAYLTPIEFTGGSGTSLESFVVTLSTPATQTVTVQYSTSNGTATAGSDYTSKSGTLTFAPGETQKIIAVVVNSDSLTEGTENFTVMLSSPTGATLTDATGLGTILDRPAAASTTGSAPQTPTVPVTEPTVPATDPMATDPTDTTTGMTMPAPAASGDYVDIMTFGMHTGVTTPE